MGFPPGAPPNDTDRRWPAAIFKWRDLVMAKRLRVFIGSSSQGKRVGEALKVLLDEQFAAALWSQGVFALSRTYIESLEEELDRADFAVLVLTPDDVTTSRDETLDSPRDNVMFELGLFTGRLGRDRCFIVRGEEEIKLPSDLAGINMAKYRTSDSGMSSVDAGAAAIQIKRAIEAQGPRPKPNQQALEVLVEQQRAAERLHGHWWEYITPDDASAVSYFELSPEPHVNSVRMKGLAYGLDGKYTATWETNFVCIRIDERKVYYFWKGYHRDTPARIFEGIGEIDFDFTGDDRLSKGRGFFSDVYFAKPETARKKQIVLRRSTPNEDRIMAGSNEQAIADLLSEKLGPTKPR